MKRISFVIPVYRNERAVTMTYDHIRQVCTGDLKGYTYEIVFIDDGSDDGSLDELLGLRARDENVRVISFTRNFGQMAAILAGFRQASVIRIFRPRPDRQTRFRWSPGRVPG